MSTVKPTTASQYTLPPGGEAVLYFIGLVLIYLASWSPPLGSPVIVRTLFGLLGSAVIIVKYELSQYAKPQIASHQALLSTLALILSVVGGQISSNFPEVWYGGLAIAVIGAVLAAYQDLKGKGTTTTPTVTATITPVVATG